MCQIAITRWFSSSSGDLNGNILNLAEIEMFLSANNTATAAALKISAVTLSSVYTLDGVDWTPSRCTDGDINTACGAVGAAYQPASISWAFPCLSGKVQSVTVKLTNAVANADRMAGAVLTAYDADGSPAAGESYSLLSGQPSYLITLPHGERCSEIG